MTLSTDEATEIARAAREESQAGQETIRDRLERLRAAVEARVSDALDAEVKTELAPTTKPVSEDVGVEEAAAMIEIVIAEDEDLSINSDPVRVERFPEVSLEIVSDPAVEAEVSQSIVEAVSDFHTETLLPVPVERANLTFSAFAFQSALYRIVVAPGSVEISGPLTEADQEPSVEEQREVDDSTRPEEAVVELAFSEIDTDDALAQEPLEVASDVAAVIDQTGSFDMAYLALYGNEFAPVESVSEVVAVAQAPTYAPKAPAIDAVEVAPVLPCQTGQVIDFPISERAVQEQGRSAGYELPSIELLAPPPQRQGEILTEDILEERAGRVEKVIRDFGVKGEVIHVHPGPVVTLYELEPAPGVKSSRVIALSEDIARSMSAVSARVAVIPGRNAIGIELPNETRETVYLREMLEAADFQASVQKLPICLGKTIGGEPVIADLARMPHLLVAGTTGSGKSVAINTMILSLLYRFTPEQCRLIMVDPKMLELSVYDGIPHLLTPVVTDPKKAIVALRWAVREMEDRYRKMSKLGVRNIDGFNARVVDANAKGEVITRTVETGFDKETGRAVYEEITIDLTPMPYIVVIVDEMADLMMVAGKEIEGAIQRLAQMARAAGIHVILATQRPSVDVITGTIKANFPTRISFQVTSKIDSRTILGEMGAEQLLGQGDMLYMAGGGRITRVHGPFCSDEEVEKVVNHLKRQGEPVYLDAVTADDEAPEELEVPGLLIDEDDAGFASGDAYEQAVSIVLRHRKASTSYIQRRLQIGYNRAASIMERMEKEGIVGPANHAGKREILRGEFED
ncbi:DNA translocase FtsK [Microvirga sp. RSM25]|uniref:DNA translocase FtsK n=1 Tax=Microvirga sp. RSM25 TaxID=3273802 RepID=UPI00384BEBF0